MIYPVTWKFSVGESILTKKICITLIKVGLAVLILGCLVGYLLRHRDEIQQLSMIRVRDLIGMYLLCAAQMVMVTIGIQRILYALGIHAGFGEMFMLHNATIFLNYVPMQFGTLFRAAYLKKRYGLGYTQFTAFFLYLMLIMVFCSAAAGAAVLVFVYHLATDEHRVTALLFVIMAIGSAIALFCPLPIGSGTSRLALFYQRLIEGRNRLSGDIGTFLICVSTLLLSFVFLAARLWLVYHSLGQSVNLLGFVVLGSLGYIAIFMSITPGGLGIRELILAGGAVMLYVPFEIGTYATLIDRVVLVSFTFFVGGLSTLILWRRAHLGRWSVWSNGKDPDPA
jgi:uncharacterized membrane protein YbhN (UPF0104 family)